MVSPLEAFCTDSDLESDEERLGSQEENKTVPAEEVSVVESRPAAKDQSGVSEAERSQVGMSSLSHFELISNMIKKLGAEGKVEEMATLNTAAPLALTLLARVHDKLDAMEEIKLGELLHETHATAVDSKAGECLLKCTVVVFTMATQVMRMHTGTLREGSSSAHKIPVQKMNQEQMEKERARVKQVSFEAKLSRKRQLAPARQPEAFAVSCAEELRKRNGSDLKQWKLPRKTAPTHPEVAQPSCSKGPSPREPEPIFKRSPQFSPPSSPSAEPIPEPPPARHQQVMRNERERLCGGTRAEDLMECCEDTGRGAREQFQRRAIASVHPPPQAVPHRKPSTPTKPSQPGASVFSVHCYLENAHSATTNIPGLRPFTCNARGFVDTSKETQQGGPCVPSDEIRESFQKVMAGGSTYQPPEHVHIQRELPPSERYANVKFATVRKATATTSPPPPDAQPEERKVVSRRNMGKGRKTVTFNANIRGGEGKNPLIPMKKKTAAQLARPQFIGSRVTRFNVTEYVESCQTQLYDSCEIFKNWLVVDSMFKSLNERLFLSDPEIAKFPGTVVTRAHLPPLNLSCFGNALLETERRVSSTNIFLAVSHDVALLAHDSGMWYCNFIKKFAAHMMERHLANVKLEWSRAEVARSHLEHDDVLSRMAYGFLEAPRIIIVNAPEDADKRKEQHLSALNVKVAQYVKAEMEKADDVSELCDHESNTRVAFQVFDWRKLCKSANATTDAQRVDVLLEKMWMEFGVVPTVV